MMGWWSSSREHAEMGQLMSADQMANVIRLLLSLVLVGSALVVRRLPQGRIFALAATWLAIIVALWALVLALQKL